MGAMPPAAQQTLSDLGLGGFIAAIGLGNGHAAWVAIQTHGMLLVGMGLVVTLVPLIVTTLFAHRVLHMNPVIICGALAGAMTVDAAVTGACEVAESQTPVLGVAVPYAVGNVSTRAASSWCPTPGASPMPASPQTSRILGSSRRWNPDRRWCWKLSIPASWP
jgi:uncharacterized transporter YbjL